MSNLVAFPNRRETRAQASEWLVSIDEGLTPEEHKRFADWLAEDPSHFRVLVDIARLWDEQSILSELSELFPLQKTPPPRHRMVFVAAATVALITVSTWFLFFETDNTSSTISVALPSSALDANQHQNAVHQRPFKTYETVVGEQLSVRLEDGSVVTLNTDSSIDIRYSQEERRILLRRGEATFNVARDAPRPFRVIARTQMLQALGTVFNVHLRGSDNVELTVSEGSVQVTDILAPDTPIVSVDSDIAENISLPHLTLSAGEVAVIDHGVASVRPIDLVDISDKLSWQEGFIVSRGDPLHVVIEDVSRYTSTRLVIADDSIRNIRVGGYFRVGDVNGLLLALEESFGIETRRVGDDLVLLTAR